MDRKKIILVILAVILISVILVVFLPKTAKAPTKISTPTPTQQPLELCKDFPAVSEKISCKEALTKALALYPGNVNSIQLTTTKFQEGPTGTPRDIEIWLIDINLENPIETEVGAMERVTVGIDIASTIEPFVEQFFPTAL